MFKKKKDVKEHKDGFIDGSCAFYVNKEKFLLQYDGEIIIADKKYIVNLPISMDELVKFVYEKMAEICDKWKGKNEKNN